MYNRLAPTSSTIYEKTIAPILPDAELMMVKPAPLTVVGYISGQCIHAMDTTPDTNILPNIAKVTSIHPMSETIHNLSL